MSHPGHGLIEQKDLGIERECRRDLESPLAAVGKLACGHIGKGRKPNSLDQFERFRIESAQNPPNLKTLERYASAVGRRIEVKLVKAA